MCQSLTSVSFSFGCAITSLIFFFVIILFVRRVSETLIRVQ